MTTAVLDATELSRDALCTGLPYQLLQNATFPWLSVVVPQSVLEEVIATHSRRVRAADDAVRDLNRERVRLGVPVADVSPAHFDYRDYLARRLEKELGIAVLPRSGVHPPDLVSDAVARTPAFDEICAEYRGSPVWASVIEFAMMGHNVALVSADRVFAGIDGRLAPGLASELESLPGTVELVRDFGAWLFDRVPWQVQSPASAVATRLSQRFNDHILQSDFGAQLRPEAEDLGLPGALHTCEIIDSARGGPTITTEIRTGPNGLAVAEFDIAVSVSFAATFDHGAPEVAKWYVDEPDFLGRVSLRGKVDMIVRAVVVFGDEFGICIDELMWRRADGTGPGTLLSGRSANQISRFELEGRWATER